MCEKYNICLNPTKHYVTTVGQITICVRESRPWENSVVPFCFMDVQTAVEQKLEEYQ